MAFMQVRMLKNPLAIAKEGVAVYQDGITCVGTVHTLTEMCAILMKYGGYTHEVVFTAEAWSIVHQWYTNMAAVIGMHSKQIGEMLK